MLKYIITVIALLPIATALTCDEVTKGALNDCNQILQENISYNEKQNFIANLIYNSNDYADHNFIEEWNSNIVFDTPPEGVEIKNSGYIKNAWLKIVSILPSVIENDTLLTPGYGKVLSGFGYKVEIPCSTIEGDCRTEYSLESKEHWLFVYLNNNLIGTSTIAEFNGNGKFDFKDILRIKTVTSIEHYKTHIYCCCHDEDGCCGYCEECIYSNTEHVTHEITLIDQKQAQYYSPLIHPKIKVIDKYLNTTVGLLQISNFTSFSLSFQNSYYKQDRHHYDVLVSLPPYDVFTLRANKFSKQSVSNINVMQSNGTYKFFVAEPSHCEIIYFDHFHNWLQSCDLSYAPANFEINTDKLHYTENETIHVKIEPKDSEIELKYGDKKIIAKNDATFTAKYPFNKITASYAERVVDKIINVRKKDSMDFVIDFGVFSGVLYFLYALMKKGLVLIWS